MTDTSSLLKFLSTCLKILLLVVFWNSQALANENSDCVSQQLKELEKLYGSERASAALHQGVTGQQNITPRNAIVFCRKLGNAYPQLKRYWPAKRLEFRIQADGLRDDANISLTKQTLSSLTRELKLKYKTTLAGTTTVLVSDNRSFLTDQLSTWSHFELSNRYVRFALNSFCAPPNPSGFTFENVIVVCNTDHSFLSSDDFRHVLAHEYFHMVQQQLAGFPAADTDAEYQEIFAPVWMLEGTADYFSIRLRSTDREFLTNSKQFLSRFPVSQFNFTRLSKHSEAYDNGRQLYLAGTVAILTLMQNETQNKLTQVFEDIGLGKKWKQSMSDRFGATAKPFVE